MVQDLPGTTASGRRAGSSLRRTRGGGSSWAATALEPLRAVSKAKEDIR